MQLPQITNQLKPIPLVAGIISVASVFAYSDVDINSQILNSDKTLSYIKVVDSKENCYLSNKFKFKHHLQRWEIDTMFSSSVSDIVNNEDFQAIVKMGTMAVPFIREEIAHKPSTLVWALNYIFERKISNRQNLTISEACKLWLKVI